MADPPDGPYPQVHHRSNSVRAAAARIRGVLLATVDEYNLTSAEYLYLLSTELAAFGQRMVECERRQTPPETPE